MFESSSNLKDILKSILDRREDSLRSFREDFMFETLNSFKLRDVKCSKGKTNYTFEFPFPGKIASDVTLVLKNNFLKAYSSDGEFNHEIGIKNTGIVKENITAVMENGLLKVVAPYNVKDDSEEEYKISIK